jgi:hypothetical protein
VGPASCYEGTQCAATILDGNYANTNSSLVSPSITLPAIGAGEEIHLRFQHWFSFGSYDQGAVYIQEQTALGVWSAAVLLASFSGTSGDLWTPPILDLSAHPGKKVRLLFGLSNGAGSSVSAGWYIDDVSVALSP